MTPRAVHPVAWWVWALTLAAAALRTHNPILLVAIIVVAWFTVVSRRSDAPWAKSFRSFLVLGVWVLGLRLVFQVIFGARLPGHVVFTIPSVGLPSWMAGASIGGEVTIESLVAGFYDGLQLAVLLGCIGAANSLASPYRLLRSMPAVLYEIGVAMTVGLSFAPHAGEAVRQVREARRLRGRPNRGVKGLRGMAIPVLESALEKSLWLAASMDSRGYGRRATVPALQRRASTVAMMAGLTAVVVGIYGVLDVGTPSGLGLPTLAAGAALCAVALFAGAGHTTRTSYRPDRWSWSEWVTVASGGVALAGMLAAGRAGGAALQPSTNPLVAPAVPIVAIVGVLVAVLPAFATPEPQ